MYLRGFYYFRTLSCACSCTGFMCVCGFFLLITFFFPVTECGSIHAEEVCVPAVALYCLYPDIPHHLAQEEKIPYLTQHKHRGQREAASQKSK